ncbi:MAG: ribosomal protein S18-alanine N-acetyltransferase [bacterium]|nr:ribosomal protein S18-alanine N-acetyltransferase [bacterium]
MKEVLEIEMVSFPIPWTERMFRQELKNRMSRFFVAEVEGKIVGYGGFWLIFDEAHIVNIAVHPGARGRKIGSRILAHLIHWVKKRDIARIVLEVRDSNRPAKNLYKKFGFIPIGIRKRYYTDTKEDAIVMGLILRGENGQGEICPCPNWGIAHWRSKNCLI